MKRSLSKLVFLLALAGLAAGLAGCSSTDEDMSQRPWNSPKTWESGLPSSMIEGR
jgi:hypothetical protein